MLSKATAEGDKFDYPEFDGDPARYRSYRVSVRWLEASIKDENKHLIAPALVRRLSGVALDLFRDRDPTEFRSDNGVTRFLALLDHHYNYLPRPSSRTRRKTS